MQKNVDPAGPENWEIFPDFIISKNNNYLAELHNAVFPQKKNIYIFPGVQILDNFDFQTRVETMYDIFSHLTIYIMFKNVK